jgi:hypothetical protein
MLSKMGSSEEKPLTTVILPLVIVALTNCILELFEVLFKAYVLSFVNKTQLSASRIGSDRYRVREVFALLSPYSLIPDGVLIMLEDNIVLGVVVEVLPGVVVEVLLGVVVEGLPSVPAVEYTSATETDGVRYEKVFSRNTTR